MADGLGGRIIMAAADVFDKTALGLGILLLLWYLVQQDWSAAGTVLFLLVVVYGGLKWVFWYFRPE